MNNAITVSNISKSFTQFDGKKFFALSDISFSIKEGETAIISGANGSGKSLLVSIIASFEKQDSGKIEIKNNEKIGLIFQDADSQILGETPLEDVSYSLKNVGFTRKEAETKAKDFLEKVGLSNKQFFPSHFLSGGEKRRLSVASILALKRKIIIFDEPFANLDYDGVKSVNQILKMLQKENHTIIILTHELEKVLSLASHFIILHNGKIVFDGSPSRGLKQNLEQWGIRPPLVSYKTHKDLLW